MVESPDGVGGGAIALDGQTCGKISAEQRVCECQRLPGINVAHVFLNP